MAEFKIARLRFNWLGEWATNTFYNKDAIVQNDGKLYACLIPHTSTNFYSELTNLNENSALVPYWEIILEGSKFVGTWQPNTLYNLGNIAIYGGNLLICTTGHTSAAQVITSANWETYAESATWHPVWTINTVYGIGDIVKWGGTVYRCNTNHISASSTALGLDADAGKWSIFDFGDGLEYRGPWIANTRYKVNDVVKLGASLFQCSIFNNDATFVEANWTLWLPGLEYANAWNTSTIYDLGDVVIYGGYSYVSNVVNNQNNIPSTDLVSWSVLSHGYNYRGVWTSSNSYRVGDVVIRGGKSFEAVIDHSGQDPSDIVATSAYTASGSSGTTLKVADTTNLTLGMIINGVGFTNEQTIVQVVDLTTLLISSAPDGTPVDLQTLTFTGLNSTYWKFVSTGVAWRGRWIEGTSANPYVVGDLVVWGNVTYQCIRPHVGILMYRPDTDITNTYWQIYAAHARKNALNTNGDIEFYNNGEYEALPIGTDTFTLQTRNQSIEYNEINLVPAVYYVAPTGTDTDEDDWGKTWDKPWGSIAYAAEQVGNGSLYQLTKASIETNIDWIVAELVNFIDYTYPTLDLTKTDRDARLVINALVYDITRGGNSQTVATALSYFKSESTNTFINSTVASQISYFIEGLNLVRDYLGYTLTATEPPTNYQSLNGVSVPVLQTLSSGEINGLIATQELLDIIIYALDNQTTTSLPIPNSGLTATIMVKTGTYNETLPITVPANTALVGDELRGTVVRPKVIIDTQVRSASQANDLFTVYSTEGLVDGTPVQFTRRTVNGADNVMGGLVAGQTYYVIGSTITATQFAVCDSLTTRQTSGNLAATSNIIYGVTNIPTFASGDPIFGPGIPQGTTVISSTINTIVMSAAATISISPPNSVDFVIGVPLTTSVQAEGTEAFMYGGDAIKDMFYVRNGSGIRNMTLSGLLGTLTNVNAYETRRPTGGSFVSLDPGTDIYDTSAWIYSRSPYIQNVTNFGQGCVGMKIDGTLHDGGNKSIVCNDFTQIISDGIGVWCTGSGSLTECVSVFSYYNYAGYFAEDGGRIRATNGNSSYGTYGVIAEGYDDTEVPITGAIYNRSKQVQASVQSAFGVSAQLLKLNFSNSGSGYYSTTENMLKYSNNLLDGAWTASSLTLNKNTTAPTGEVEAWTLTAGAVPGSSSISQTVTVAAPGKIYTGLTAVNITGTGGLSPNTPATFDVTVTADGYKVVVNNAGSGYVSGSTLLISGIQLGGVNTVNDCILEIDGLIGSTITSVIPTGTVPQGTTQYYTVSAYVKQGTASNIGLSALWSGNGAFVNFDFSTKVVTPGKTTPSGYAVVTPSECGAIQLADGWYRLWVSFYDQTAQDTSLLYSIYPNGTLSGTSGTYSYVYGTQVQVAPVDYEPTFYLETTGNQYNAHANYQILGAGTGVETLADETRSYSVFQTRVTTDTLGVTGGAGYLTASNSSQTGNAVSVTLAQSDNNLETNYIGMRVFINSGLGAGQYGYISKYDSTFKVAQVLKESFDVLKITNTSSSGNLITLDGAYDTTTLYTNQAIQFIPTYYTLAISSISLNQQVVSNILGGVVNTITVPSTAQMTVNMPVKFTGTAQGQVSVGFTYYISSIVGNTIQIAIQPFGVAILLNTVTAVSDLNITYTANNSYISGSTSNMSVNLPIQFTGEAISGLSIGTQYYINDVLDITTFTISQSLITVTPTSSDAITDTFAVSSTSTLINLHPIVFSGTVFGGVVEGTKYYIGKISTDGSNTFSIASSLIYLSVTATESGTNLITTTSTTGMIQNNPIIFVGTTFGGITAEQVYYIQVINGPTTFTVSLLPGGSALPLTDSSGIVTAKTAGTPFGLATVPSGSMTGTTTNVKETLTYGSGVTSATFSTALFGNVVAGTTYYVKTIDSVNNQITISDTSGPGSAFSLSTKTGNMNIGAVGWDHINPGTPIESVLDYSSAYFVEPRVTFTDPQFTKSPSTPSTLVGGTSYTSIAYGDGMWMAFPDNNSTASRSYDGVTWTSVTLPSIQSWTGVSYGNGWWVGISNGSVAIYSNSEGVGWRSTTMPTSQNWNLIAYGNGKFAAIGGQATTYSSTYGQSWTSSTALSITGWTGLAYGKGKFVAVASGSRIAATSTNGSSWTETATALPATSAWSGIAYGNGRFVAVASTLAKPAYSFDGITWYQSNISIAANEVSYGQGVFLAVSSTQTFTSEDGLNWKTRTSSNANINATVFGFTKVTQVGTFITVGSSSATLTYTGTRAKGRPIVTSGVITSISQWEPGSNYNPGSPTITVTDTNVTTNATFSTRIGNGALASPTFLNNGAGYSTTSTTVTVTGDGYSDAFQTGLTLTVKNLTDLPQPGDNLAIAGNSKVYKVTSATAVFGTVAPTIEANIQIDPEMTVALSPNEGTVVTIRQKYSQARLTGHDFLNIGYGNAVQANYPGFPAATELQSQNQTVENNYGRVFYTTTDQDGNFKVGSLFGVEQATGIVTLSASQFGLTGLSTISLGGIAVGGSSVVITQFSTDKSFVANSDSIIPTQRAIKAYLTGRLSQGGANTFTGLLTAGSTVVGGPNKIYSATPVGSPGSSVIIKNKANFTGALAGVDGDMVAFRFFMTNGVYRS